MLRLVFIASLLGYPTAALAHECWWGINETFWLAIHPHPTDGCPVSITNRFFDASGQFRKDWLCLEGWEFMGHIPTTRGMSWCKMPFPHVDHDMPRGEMKFADLVE